MFQLRKQFALIHHRIDRLLIHDSNFGHLLHGIHSLKLLSLDFPHFTKAALADNTMELEVLLSDH